MNETKIKLLPDSVANKIAAGEVVQRPESVVKELMENAIDANSKNIHLYIKNAGKTIIQVIDDGEGMGPEDAMKCLERHATSKIASFDDLQSLKSYGFRGEALSSIASVSQLEIRTERKDDEVGAVVRVEDGVATLEKGSFAKGTSISVKNLFYNTPARRNFLKSNATELKHIIETFRKIALSHPEIYFKLFNDDEVVFDFPIGSMDERVKDVIADNILESVIFIKEMTEYISVYGYLAKPTYLRKSKGEQYFFLNRRYVVSKTINHAVFSAFDDLLDKGDYPFFLLFMDIDSSKIDINVHPAKLEVKFEDEKDVYSFVHAVVKKALGSHDLVPSITFQDNDGEKARLDFTGFRRSDTNDFSDRPSFIPGIEAPRKRAPIFDDDEVDALFGNINREIKQNAPAASVEDPFNEKTVKEISSVHSSAESENSSFIISLHNKYILCQIKSGLMIIDQHVAHERILYEKAMNSFNADIPFSQQLLFSQTMNCDPGEYQLLIELEPHLTKLGFDLKFFSKNTVVIDGVPSDVKIGTETDVLSDILDEYRKNFQEKKLEERDNLAKSFSCKAAIKAGDKMSEREMRVLVDQLFATSMPYVCPHGRPIIIKISLDEFDKKFGRT
jgi:DNA mismatch repair protein MutL